MQSTEMMLERVSGVATASNAKQWLRELPISDARSAHHAVSALLRELSQVTPGPRERLEILETVRGHVAGIDLRYARRYVGKPLSFPTSGSDDAPNERNPPMNGIRIFIGSIQNWITRESDCVPFTPSTASATVAS